MQAALPYNRCLSCCTSKRPTSLHVAQTVQVSTSRRAGGTTLAAASTPAAAGEPATAVTAASALTSAIPEGPIAAGTQARSRRQTRATRGKGTTSNATPLAQDQQLPEQLPPQQQQQEQEQEQEQASLPEPPAVQQPRIVLTPLSNTSPAAAGSIFRSSQLGSWSAMDSAASVSNADTYVKPAAQNQQQQQQEQWQKQKRHDQQRHRQQQSRQQQEGAQWSSEQQQQQQQGWEGQTQAWQAQQRRQRQQQPLPLPGPLPLPSQQQWQQRQQLPPPQHQQRQKRGHKQQRLGHREQEQIGVDAKLLTEARQLTLKISRAKDLNQLWAVLSESHQSPAFNLVNISTAYKTCADFFLKQPRHQQEQQVLQQQQLSLDDAAAVQGNSAFDKVLLLLDQQTALHLSMAAAAASKMASSSSSSSTADPLGSSPEWNVRSLSGIVHSCARMRRKLPWAVLVLLLEAFLMIRHQDQQQLSPLAQEDSLQQQQQQQQQQGPQDQLRPGDSGKSAAATAAAPSSSSSSSSSSSNGSNSSSSSKQTEEQATCHALSLLCWGLSKLGFTTSSVYQHSSSSSRREEDQQRRLEQQQQYWARLAAVGTRVAMEGSPRSLSTLCYAFAAGGFRDVALWGRLGAAAVRHMPSFTPQEFAQTVWAFATAGVAYKPMLTEACAVAVDLAPGLTPQGLGNVLWALTTQIGYVPPKVLVATQEACLRMDMDRFGSVNITILVGALARQGSIRMELAVAINRAVERNLQTFSPDNVCKVLSGLGVLNCLQQPLMDAVEPRLLNDLRSGTVDMQQACHGVWGVAITDPSRALNLLPALLQLGSQRVHILGRSSDAASKLCATMALTRYRDDALVDSLAQYLTTGSADAAPTAAPAAAAAPASGGSNHSDRLFTMSAGPAAHGAGVGSPLCHWDRPATPKHLVSIAVMLAKLGFSQHTTLLEAIIQRFLELTSGPSKKFQDYRDHRSSSNSNGSFGGNSYAQEDDPIVEIRKARTRDLAVRLLWCAAVLDMRQPTLLQQLLKHLKGAADLSTAGMAQLVQVHMWLQTLGPAGQSLIATIPKAILQEAEVIWRKQLVPYVIHSQLHSQVLTQLSAMQLRFQSEAVTLDGMFSVDIVVQYKGCAVALEVLGPDHYTSNAVRVPRVGTSQHQHQQQQQQQQQEQHALLGPELLRFRLLAARNLALAAVSSFEASGAVATAAGAQALRQLLKQKLEEAVQLHMQYKAANAQPLVDVSSSSSGGGGGGGVSGGGQASQTAAVKGLRRGRMQTQPPPPQQQQLQQSQAEVDLSRLLLQPGYSKKQQRLRRSRAQHLEQRQQRRSQARVYNSKQGAMQTLLSVAGRDARADTAAATSAAGHGYAAAAADASGSSGGSGLSGFDEGVSVVSSVEDVADRAGYDSEFDLPLDLEDLA